jgi:hypothetical protein
MSFQAVEARAALLPASQPFQEGWQHPRLSVVGRQSSASVLLALLVAFETDSFEKKDHA